MKNETPDPANQLLSVEETYNDNEPYSLLFKRDFSVNKIAPLLSLNDLIQKCNKILQVPREDHDHYQKNLLAKMVRLSWLVHNLKEEPIMKPLLLNLRHFQVTVSTGDTRLQAIAMNPHVIELPCLLSIKSKYVDQFPDWKVVDDLHHLALACKMLPEEIVFEDGFQSWYNKELQWIEFDLYESGNHMHDEPQRLRMMYNYLDTKDDTFEFSREWLNVYRDQEYWIHYDY